MRAQAVVAAVWVAACVGEIPDHADHGAKAIINGTQDPGDDNVVALVSSTEGFFCTGTLVAPRVVVTAAHCLLGESVTSLRVYFGPQVGNGGRQIPVVAGGPHPEANDDNLDGVDIGVLALAQAAPFAPKEMNGSPFQQSFINKPLRLVGYGTDDPQGDGGGLKRQATTRVTSYNEAELDFGGTGTSACFGDSGGPAFMNLNSREVLVGVTSRGDDACTAGTYSRVDVHLQDFIRPFIDRNGGMGGTGGGTGGTGGGTQPPPPPPPSDGGGECGSITYDGICEGDVLSYCDEEGYLVSYQCSSCGCTADGWCDCADDGLGGDPGAGGYPPGGDGCDGIDYFGACDGDVLLWCNEGQLGIVDCAQMGAFCDLESDDIGFNCL